MNDIKWGFFLQFYLFFVMFNHQTSDFSWSGVCGIMGEGRFWAGLAGRFGSRPAGCEVTDGESVGHVASGAAD